jgi:hypothetical protein
VLRQWLPEQVDLTRCGSAASGEYATPDNGCIYKLKHRGDSVCDTATTHVDGASGTQRGRTGDHRSGACDGRSFSPRIHRYLRSCCRQTHRYLDEGVTGGKTVVELS